MSDPARSGVLGSQHLLRAITERIVTAHGFEVPAANVQPASLDLRLSEEAYRIRCSFLPDDQSVRSKLKRYTLHELNLHSESGAVLETNRPYLVRLKEHLSLPEDMRGKANPKSSTGRIDVFTRVITDHSHRFDEISPGYDGPLWLEVVPLSFPIRIREDMSLNQLRLVVGRPELGDDDIREFHARTPLLFEGGEPVPTERLSLSNGLFLGLDLCGDRSGRVGYRARDSAPLLDLTSPAPTDPSRFWEPVYKEDGDRIILDPRKFYLLMSREEVSIAPPLASEMTAYDPTSGELRTHYAGFFDPGFGYDAERRFSGSRAALEVRAHDVPFMVEHGQKVCKLTFERMLEVPQILYGGSIGSSYQRQGETLSKYFLSPAARESRTAAPPAEEEQDGSGGQLPLLP